MLKGTILSACFMGAILLGGSVHAASHNLDKIQVPSKVRKMLKSFEPSSALYLSDLDSYVISSDDTDKKETPYLFLMDAQGKVNDTPLVVQGLQQMTDIESISQDQNGNIYLLSSLSINKNGKIKESRNLFVRATRRGTSLVLAQQVELRTLLIEAIRNSGLPEFSRLSRDLGKELDIESHFILNGELYVGVKNPQPRRDHALILNLGSVEYLFNSQEIENLSIWRTVDFSSAGSECLVSDMQISGDSLYLSTTSDQGDPGKLWHLQISTNVLTEFESYNGVKPEGLALNDKDNSLMVVFDEGDATPYYHLRNRF